MFISVADTDTQRTKTYIPIFLMMIGYSKKTRHLYFMQGAIDIYVRFVGSAKTTP